MLQYDTTDPNHHVTWARCHANSKPLGRVALAAAATLSGAAVAGSSIRAADPCYDRSAASKGMTRSVRSASAVMPGEV